MFSFQWPWMAVLLVLPLLIRQFWRRSQVSKEDPSEAGRLTLLHPALARLAQSFGSVKQGSTRGDWIRLALLALAWACLVVAMMRPQWVEQYTQVKSEGYDLMLAVDGSRSMEALDFSVGGRRVARMAVVKGVVGRFIDARQGDRIGLILFGEQAYVLSPLTLDGAAVRALLDNVASRMAGDGTAIGDAIGLAVAKLRERPEGSRVLILVTDGENTSGSLSPRLAADLAAEHGIRIYTIGVGTRGMVPIMRNGRMTYEEMDLDERLLRDVAAKADGVYFQATNSRALEEIYQRIDALEKTEAESRTMWLAKPLYRWPLGLGLLALLGLGLFPDGRRRVMSKEAVAS